MKVHFEVIPNEKQRYPTVGDYWQEGDTDQFRVSAMANEKYELLVFIHELIEAYLCRWQKVSWREIDAFDIEYEKNRLEGDVSEPGDNDNAPYYSEHQFATLIERLLAYEFGIQWNKYNDTIENL